MPRWESTSWGQQAKESWERLLAVYGSRLPSHYDSLRNIMRITVPTPRQPAPEPTVPLPTPRGGLPVLPYGTPLTGSAAIAWADAILEALSAPTSKANVTSMTEWFLREGGGGANNPMNTTLDTAGVTETINSAGVKSYATPADGVAATAETLLDGYPAIVEALRGGGGLVDRGGAVAQELLTWSGGGYSSV